MNFSNLNYQEQQRRQVILNTLENEDYLLTVANSKGCSVEEVKHELRQKLILGERS